MNIDGNRFRQARFASFLSVADRVRTPDAPIRILDIGGTQSYWEALRPLWANRNFDITIVNLDAPANDNGPYHIRPGNACAMPEHAEASTRAGADGHVTKPITAERLLHVVEQVWAEKAARAAQGSNVVALRA